MLALTLETHTWLHRIPAPAKLFALVVVTVLLLPVTDLRITGGFLIIVTLLYASLGGIAIREGVRLFRPILLILLVILAWHVVLGEPRAGLVICARILALVALANLVTMTTRLDDMIAVVTWLLSPLRRFGLAPSTFGLAVALTIRSIPVVLMKAEALRMAWRARSARRPGVQTLFPLALMTLDDAEHMSDALRARSGLASQETG